MSHFIQRFARKAEPDFAEEGVLVAVEAMQKVLDEVLAQGTDEARTMVAHLVPLLRQAVTGAPAAQFDDATNILPTHAKTLPKTRPQLFSELEDNLKYWLSVVTNDLPSALSGKEDEVFTLARHIVSEGIMAAHTYEQQALQPAQGRC